MSLGSRCLKTLQKYILNQEAKRILKNFKAACKLRKNAMIATMLDLLGPIYLIDNIDEEIVFKKDHVIRISSQSVRASEEAISISNPSLLKLVAVGQAVYMSDRKILGAVTSISDDFVEMEIKNEGKIVPGSDIFFVGKSSNNKELSEKDEGDLLNLGLKEGFDFIVISLTQTRNIIDSVRDLLGPKGAHIKIIAKVEDKEGIKNFEDILCAADGIMIGRGDLGVNIGVKKLMTAQKYLIERANLVGKPIITATQLLYSMIEMPFPTRAEISDISNAVYDGSSGLTLSTELTEGSYPIKCVEMMASIVLEAEQGVNYKVWCEWIYASLPRPVDTNEALYATTVRLAYYTQSRLILCISEDEISVNLLCKYKPQQPILALCMSASIVRQMNICTGVIALKIPSYIGTDNLIHDGIAFALEKNLISKGQNLVVVLGKNEDNSNESRCIRIVEA